MCFYHVYCLLDCLDTWLVVYVPSCWLTKFAENQIFRSPKNDWKQYYMWFKLTHYSSLSIICIYDIISSDRKFTVNTQPTIILAEIHWTTASSERRVWNILTLLSAIACAGLRFSQMTVDICSATPLQVPKVFSTAMKRSYEYNHELSFVHVTHSPEWSTTDSPTIISAHIAWVGQSNLKFHPQWAKLGLLKLTQDFSQPINQRTSKHVCCINFIVEVYTSFLFVLITRFLGTNQPVVVSISLLLWLTKVY